MTGTYHARFVTAYLALLLVFVLGDKLHGGPYPPSPVISKVALTELSATSATVTFSTYPGALGYVVFERVNPAIGKPVTVQTGVGLTHSGTAKGLVPGAHYRAVVYARFNWLASLTSAPPVFFTTPMK